jgi:aspartyl-tRNA(Asn)/glutamyl-tRNA(Gln) amidotransferase subunit A
MSQLMNLTLVQAKKGLENGDFTSKELVSASFKNIAAKKDLNAFILTLEEQALKNAEESDKKIASKQARALEGIPVAIKDLFCNKNIATTSCSHILDGFKPSYESTVTEKLFAGGAISLGKTNMDEFAMGSANITSYYGNVKNPWKKNNDDADLVPGGSSGGSAVAVAADLCFGSLGSDTGGSVRQPASFCGVVGVKPTYGRCSRWGMIAFASSLDQAGVFAKTVEDSAILLESICGHDSKDSTSVDLAVPNFSKATKNSIKGMKIGIPHEYHSDNMSDEIQKLWNQGKAWLKDAGAEIVEISLEYTKYALPAYYIIAPAEASSNLSRYDGVRYGLRVQPENCSIDQMYSATRAKGFGDEVKRRIMIGTYVLSAGYYDAYYKKAQKIRSLIADDFARSFAKVDAILTPTTPTPAFGIGEKLDPVTMYLNDVFTVPASLAGLPGISVPAGLSSAGLPLGLQIIGRPYDEETMFNVAAKLESSANFSKYI